MSKDDALQRWHAIFDAALQDPVRYKLDLIGADDNEIDRHSALNAEAAPTENDRNVVQGLIEFEQNARIILRKVIADAIERLAAMDDRTLISNHSMATENARQLREGDPWRDVMHVDARINEAMTTVFLTEMERRHLTLAQGNTPGTAS